MHFQTDADPAEISTLIKRCITITGWRYWQRRLTVFREQISANPMLETFFLQRFGLELAFDDVSQHYRHTGRYPWPPTTAEQQRFYSFVAMTARVHQRLGDAGKKRLKGMLLDGLKSDYGLGPLAFEMIATAHLMTRGFDVSFQDIEKGGGFDFLAVKDPVELEVECKFVSADIGRQIHQKRLHDLGEVLKPVLHAALKSSSCSRLVRVTLPDRLTSQKDQQIAITKSVAAAMSQDGQHVNSERCSVTVDEFSTEKAPFDTLPPNALSREFLERFLAEHFGIDNKHALMLFNPNHGAVIVVVESVKPDTVLLGIYRQLKDSAKKQFTGKRPAVLWCCLADLSEDQLRSLAEQQAEGTGLQRAATEILTRRPRIHTLAFSCPGTVKVQKTLFGNTRQTSTQESGPVYHFINPNHPLANDPTFAVF